MRYLRRLLVLAVLCICYILLTREKNFSSGLVLGLGLMKFHLLLMFPVWMILQKRWRMLAGFAATGAVFLAAALALLDDPALDILIASAIAFEDLPGRLVSVFDPKSGVVCPLIRYPDAPA